jgi:nitroreductase
MEFDDVLKERKCVRDYNANKKVNFDDLMTVCEAARYSPMAGNIYSVRLVIVSDKDKKQEIAQAALEQEFIGDANYVIVVCSDKSNLVRSYGKEAEMYARQQAGAAIENMLLTATDLGLAVCWVGAFEEKMLKRVLAIPEHIQIEAIIPLAIALKKEESKRKPVLKAIAFFERWGQKTAKPIRKPGK